MNKNLAVMLSVLLGLSAAGCSVADKINEKSEVSESSAAAEEPAGSEVSGGIEEALSEETSEEQTAVPDTPTVVLPDEDGYAEGYLHDTMRNAFFDFVINSAEITTDYKGITPAEGKELLVVNITMENTTSNSVPMFDTDFFLYQRNDEENPYIDPITAADPELKADGMLGSEYSIGIHETVTGDLVYEVPEGQKDFVLAFEEYFENEEYGDIFVVLFTAK